MVSVSENKLSLVSVQTTLPALPLPLNEARARITTDRLIIRPIVPGDLNALHTLRTQPEIMAKNPQGKPDRDLDETRARFQNLLPPKDETAFNFAICLRDSDEMIGYGGCYRMSSMLGAWPTIGYMLHPEFWGRGITTEFVRAWLAMWCKLPRRETEIQVAGQTVDVDKAGPVQERIVTWTTKDNAGSQRVLEKSGFERFLVWREPDLRNPDVDVSLVGYRFVISQGASDVLL